VRRSRGLSLPENHPPSDVRLTGSASPTAMLQLKIVFAVRDKQVLDQLQSELQDPTSKKYRQWLTPRDFERRFGQSSARVREVERWLTSNGLRILRADANEIIFRATVAQAEKVFAVHIAASSDGTVYANTNDPRIPAQFAEVIGMIDGLDNLRRAKSQAIRSPELEGLYSFKPSDFYTFYSEKTLLDAGIDGHSLAHPKPGPRPVYECGMAFAETSNYLDSDIALFNSTYSLRQLPNGAAGIQRVFIGADPGLTGSQDETVLDIDWGHAVAPGAIIWVYISSDLNAAKRVRSPMVDAVPSV
jgi:subtilase family serine protease